MKLANQEAQRFNHEYVGTEHILLGLIKVGGGDAWRVLMNYELDLRKMRIEVEKTCRSGPDMVTMGKLPHTPRAKNVISFAIEEAGNLENKEVGTEHLLLGLLREQEGMAAQILKKFLLDSEIVRAALLDQVNRDLENGGSVS